MNGPVKIIAALALSLSCFPPSRADEPTKEKSARKRALVVACTAYDELQNKKYRLEGPANDAPAFAEMLVRRFGFAKEDIVILSEAAGAGKQSLRPLRANIEREFQSLAAAAQPGESIVVLLGGHGSRQPAQNPKDPKYPKPDGLEGIFLPADVGRWDEKNRVVAGAIAEHELRQWTHAITEKKAHLWLIVDACHSAMSLRGEAAEVPRGVEPKDLGIPDEVLGLAPKAPTESRGGAEGDTSGLALDDQSPNFAAIYAALPHEAAWEGKFATDGKMHGYLTMGILQVLMSRKEPLTYRELAALVDRKLRDRLDQHPTTEGLARTKFVLHHEHQREATSVLSGSAAKGWTIDLGELQGAGEGSIFEVLPPVDAANPMKPVGYVKVTEAGLFESHVVPCEYAAGGKKAQPVSDAALAKEMRCIPVYLTSGSLRLRVAISPFSGNGKEPAAKITKLKEIEADLADRIKNKGFPIVIVTLAEQPEWVVQERGEHLVLLPAAAAQVNDPSKTSTLLELPEEDSSYELRKHLARIARGQNLLRVANQQETQRSLASTKADARMGVQLEMVRLRDSEDKTGTTIPDGTMLSAGDIVGWRITNHCEFPVDATLLLVGRDFKIEAAFPRAGGSVDNRISNLLGQNSVLASRARAKRPTTAPEHMVLIAVKSPGGESIAFTAFAEESEELARGAQIRGNESDTIDSPVGKLLQEALYGSSNDRGAPAQVFRQSYLGEVSWKVVEKVVTSPP